MCRRVVGAVEAGMRLPKRGMTSVAPSRAILCHSITMTSRVQVHHLTVGSCAPPLNLSLFSGLTLQSPDEAGRPIDLPQAVFQAV